MSGRVYLGSILWQCATGLDKLFTAGDTGSACPIAYDIMTGITNALGGELSSMEE